MEIPADRDTTHDCLGMPSELLYPTLLQTEQAVPLQIMPITVQEAVRKKYSFLQEIIHERYGMELLMSYFRKRVNKLNSGEQDQLRLHNNELARLLANYPDKSLRSQHKLLRLGKQLMDGCGISADDTPTYHITAPAPDTIMTFRLNEKGELLLGSGSLEAYAAARQLFEKYKQIDLYEMLRTTVLAMHFDRHIPQQAVPVMQRRLLTPAPLSFRGRKPEWPFNNGVPEAFRHLLLPRLRFLLLSKGQMENILEGT